MNENEILVGVCGAHMSDLPLNWQLTELNSTFVKKTKTKKVIDYMYLKIKTQLDLG